MLRILYLSAFYPYPPDNGARIRIYNLLRELAAWGHNIHLLTLATAMDMPSRHVLQNICATVQPIPFDPFEQRVTSLRSYLSLTPRAVLDAYDLTVDRTIKNVLATHNYDVVVADTRIMAHYVANVSEVPIILSEQNALTQWQYEDYQRETRPLPRLWKMVRWLKCRRYESMLFSKFDLCTVVSQPDADAVRSIVPNVPVAIVPNGVDVDHYKPNGTTLEPNTLVFNGALTYHPNFEAMDYFLSDIWPALKQEEPAVCLKITGNTNGVALQELRLDDHVYLTGYLPDIRPTVASAWACIVPLLFGSGTRLKILEAMALGTPVIATSKGAEGLAVSPGKNILIADDPGNFAAQTVRLLRDFGLRQQLAESGRQLVEEKYSWQAIGKRFHDLLQSITLRRRV